MRTIDLSIPKGAIFSDNREYRFALWRSWSPRHLPLLFIGLNPSTANELSEDPTVTRMMTRAAKYNFGGLLVGNLYAFVSCNPDVLLGDGDFIGVENDDFLHQMIGIAGKVVCGWGSFPAAARRANTVLKMIPEPYCLGTNKNRQPKHPLYIGFGMPIQKYEVSLATPATRNQDRGSC